MSGGVMVLVGTTKGGFILSSTSQRDRWTVTGPHCDGWPINHMVQDRKTGTLYAGGGGEWQGAGIWRSADEGKTWSLTKLSRGEADIWAQNDPDFAAMIGWQDPETQFDGEADAVWSLAAFQGRVFAGAKPGKLFFSQDGGETFQSVKSFNEHKDREDWSPGAVGLTLHTIVLDEKTPQKIWLGVSAAGVFASEDGGKTWETRNRLANGEVCGDHDHPAAPRDGMTGLCVHNMVRVVGANDDLLYQQNHHGVFKSHDGGRSWHDITMGLPSAFGFPIAANPKDPEMVFTIPLNGDSQGRYPPDASAAVWRSANGGKDWEPKRQGLPQTHCYFTVLRQAMATDDEASPGVYFGTNTGSVFGSFDTGDSWKELASHLPTVLSVEIASHQMKRRNRQPVGSPIH